MNDEDLLRSGLATLVTAQPVPGDRLGEVHGRIRRRARRRTAAVAAAAGVAVAGAAVTVGGPGDGDGVERTLPPAVESAAGLPWEPRGELVDRAGDAVEAWAPEGVDRLRVLFAGALTASPVRAEPARSAERWYVLQGDPGNGLQVAVLRDGDGDGPARPEVVGQQAAPDADAAQVSVVRTPVPAGQDLVWPGKDGVDLRSTLFVLPRPDAGSVTRDTPGAGGSVGLVALPPEPSLTEVATPPTPLRVQVDGGAFERAGMPGSQPAELTLPPIPVPAGWVEVQSGSGSSGVISGGPLLQVPLRLLVRCTTWGEPMTVAYQQPAETLSSEAVCDGTVQEPFGVVQPLSADGVDRLDRGSKVVLQPSDDVDAARFSVVVRAEDAEALGVVPAG